MMWQNAKFTTISLVAQYSTNEHLDKFSRRSIKILIQNHKERNEVERKINSTLEERENILLYGTVEGNDV